jgi:hypothetical protein
MGEGKAFLNRRGGQRKFLLGMEERGRSTEVEDDWDYPPVLKLISFTPLQMTMLHITYLFKQGLHWFINSCGSAMLWQ